MLTVQVHHDCTAEKNIHVQMHVAHASTHDSPVTSCASRRVDSIAVSPPTAETSTIVAHSDSRRGHPLRFPDRMVFCISILYRSSKSSICGGDNGCCVAGTALGRCSGMCHEKCHLSLKLDSKPVARPVSSVALSAKPTWSGFSTRMHQASWWTCGSDVIVPGEYPVPNFMTHLR